MVGTRLICDLWAWFSWMQLEKLEQPILCCVNNTQFKVLYIRISVKEKQKSEGWSLAWLCSGSSFPCGVNQSQLISPSTLYPDKRSCCWISVIDHTRRAAVWAVWESVRRSADLQSQPIKTWSEGLRKCFKNKWPDTKLSSQNHIMWWKQKHDMFAVVDSFMKFEGCVNSDFHRDIN